VQLHDNVKSSEDGQYEASEVGIQVQLHNNVKSSEDGQYEASEVGIQVQLHNNVEVFHSLCVTPFSSHMERCQVLVC
jgi:putative lipoic acid-binding regulatory protein